MCPERFKGGTSLTKNQSRGNRGCISPHTVEEIFRCSQQVIQKHCRPTPLSELRQIMHGHVRLTRPPGYGNAFHPGLLVRNCELLPSVSLATWHPSDEWRYGHPLSTIVRHRYVAYLSKYCPFYQEAHEWLLCRTVQ
jgi:hypothetical protein